MLARLRSILAIVASSMILVSCADEPAVCVPDEISTRLSNSVNSIAPTEPLSQMDPSLPAEIHVYLDYSKSMRGFFKGASCDKCLPEKTVQQVIGLPTAKGGKPGSERKQLTVPRDLTYRDSLFSNIILQMTGAPLKALPGSKLEYHLFADKPVGNVAEDVFDTLSKEDSCYRDAARREINRILEGKPPQANSESKDSKSSCYFDKDDFEKFVGTRERSSINRVFDEIAKSKNINSLYVIGSDLFFRSRDITGASASAIIPLAQMIRQGFEVQVFGFQVPYLGHIEDVPIGRYPVRGRLPFYLMAIGSPATLKKFEKEMLQSASRLTVQEEAGGDWKPLIQSSRFRTARLGSFRENQSRPAFPPPQVISSDSLTGSLSSLIESPFVMHQHEFSSSTDLLSAGRPLSIRWTIPPDVTGQQPVNAADFSQEILAWRATSAATGANCSQAWEQVSIDIFNPSPLRMEEANVLETTLFNGGGSFSVEVNEIYAIYASIYNKKEVSDNSFDWVRQWSSGNTTIQKDAQEAERFGGMGRTYNLEDFIIALRGAVPSAVAAAIAPAASTVIAARFK